ncbi:hypothetical protein C8R46DRAFT_1058145 [Mycena filopes]|nr:hypothetical protein C8R46DRAFT_1058145 [Mycena filopes]
MSASPAAAPTHIAMPQPTYAPLDASDSYPPSSRDDSFTPPSSSTIKPHDLVAARSISRTPSPTPSEVDILNGVKKKRTTGEMIRTYILVAVVVAGIVLIEVFHDKIINALSPVTNWLHDTPAGWLIPIVVLIALSFPPLFGHELVGILVGSVWGLGAGFWYPGTLLGEVCTYYVFRTCLGARAKRWELSNVGYGALSHVIRTGGLLVPIVVRYSSIPAHFTTAIFATCGMPFWVFLVAAVASLPKQFALVYVGYALKQDSPTSNKVQKAVIGVTVVVTVAAMVYMRRQMPAGREAVVYARRKARQGKMQEIV